MGLHIWLLRMNECIYRQANKQTNRRKKGVRNALYTDIQIQLLVIWTMVDGMGLSAPWWAK